MKTLEAVCALLFSLAAGGLALAEGAGDPTPSSVASPVVLPAMELNWIELDPTGAPGVKVADLWGDHRTGAFGAIFRLPPGFKAPLHSHTEAMKVVILSGTYIQAPEGKPEFRLDPGSYLMQPGGTYRHMTRCDPAAECVFFVESDGAFDLQSASPEGDGQETSHDS